MYNFQIKKKKMISITTLQKKRFQLLLYILKFSRKKFSKSKPIAKPKEPRVDVATARRAKRMAMSAQKIAANRQVLHNLVSSVFG